MALLCKSAATAACFSPLSTLLLLVATFRGFEFHHFLHQPFEDNRIVANNVRERSLDGRRLDRKSLDSRQLRRLDRRSLLRNVLLCSFFRPLSCRQLVLVGRIFQGLPSTAAHARQREMGNSSSESAFPLKMLLSLVTVRSVGGGLLFSAIVELIRMKNDGESDQRHKGCQKRKPMR